MTTDDVATGETDLGELLRSMRPELVPGDWFFGSVESAAGVTAAATVLEPEGLSVVVDRVEAERLGLGTENPFRWITLRVHSSLDAVGLTAAVSVALTAHDISCNVIAGAFHDHLLVPAARADEAMGALVELSASA
ncbi:MAG: hypothetical protein RLZZ608_841 [Actinomycetota bacterium]|jgi:hypothetical protein